MAEENMARANVPEFGKWDSGDNVPYTVYFDKARKNRGGKMINQNDPGENPEMFPNLGAPARVPPSRTVIRQEEPMGRGGFKGGPEQRFLMEDGDFRHSPARVENQGQRVANESSYGRGHRTARSGRISGGSDHGYEKSPLHPQQHGSTERGRIRQNRVDESPDRGATVPKFGEWDPQSAENFSYVFDKVREERNGLGNSPYTPKHPSHSTSSQPPKTNQPKSCCFPW